jgi:hypothetical protein
MFPRARPLGANSNVRVPLHDANSFHSILSTTILLVYLKATPKAQHPSGAECVYKSRVLVVRDVRWREGTVSKIISLSPHRNFLSYSPFINVVNILVSCKMFNALIFMRIVWKCCNVYVIFYNGLYLKQKGC